MTVNLVTSAQRATAQQYNDIAGTILGVPGYGQYFDLIQYDGDRYYLVVKNLHSNAKVAQFLKYDGTVLLEVNGTSGKMSPDGTTAATVLTTTHAQDISGKTITGMGGRLVHKRMADVASAGTLPSIAGGDVAKVTGTANITSIAATYDGHIVSLIFTGNNAKVRRSSTLNLHGDFVSTPDATLTIICDGTEWWELGRSRHALPGCRLYKTSGQNISSGATEAVTWDAAAWDHGGLWSSGATITPGYQGLWRVMVNTVWETQGGEASVDIFRNGSVHTRIGGGTLTSSGQRTSLGGVTVIPITSSSDTIDLRAQHSAGGGRSLIDGDRYTHIIVEWVSPYV